MKFKLAYPQHIVLGKQHIYFLHDVYHGVALNRYQFDNLHDMIYSNMNLSAYPLGEGAWLMHRNDGLCLQTRSGYFLFYRKSWKEYKKRVHRRIRIILHHGERAYGEYDADDESNLPHRPRRRSSRARRKTAKGTTRNAHTPHVGRKKYSNVSKRDNSNPRSDSTDTSGCHVSRTDTTNTFTSVSNDDFECSDECTINEETLPVEDSMQ